MLRTSVRPFNSLFTHFLMEKDQLTAHFARFGSGFILDDQLKIAKEHLQSIQDLLKEVEERKNERKPPVLVEPFNCYSGSCYKK